MSLRKYPPPTPSRGLLDDRRQQLLRLRLHVERQFAIDHIQADAAAEKLPVVVE